MSIFSVTTRGRAFALARMLDTCTVTRQTSNPTDPDTGVGAPVNSTIYTGKCRIRQAIVMGRPVVSGEAQQYQQHSVLSLPLTAAVLAVDDLVTPTASALTPTLIGRKFRVRALAGDTSETAARYEVMEFTS
jgi:hypothetical protein